MAPIERSRWLCRGNGKDLGQAAVLSRELGVSLLVARTLCLRGIANADQGREFLQSRLADLPDPFLLSGMAPAADRLAGAVENGERIAVHGDYDVDGITGTALLVEALRSFGAQVEYFIPLRLRDGYGLAADALESAAAAGIRVVVTVDCGVCAVAEADLAASLGLDLIITDHHQPPERLPQAYAIINPCLPGERFPASDLAGVGVAFFLLAALRRTLRERRYFLQRSEPDLRESLDLVALGTIADLVPLRGVNRSLARAGLGLLSRAPRPGLQALMRVAGVEEVSCGAVAFRLAPRLNAAGRLEDAALGVELLLSTSPAAAGEIAETLDSCNRERQRLEETTLSQALERLEAGEGGERSIVLADARWHPGVIGIVASRLVERFHRPVVLIALEEGRGKGSARSIAGFHLYQALQHCSEHLEAFGGHECAAGLSIARPALDSFTAAFAGVAQQILTEEDLLPRLRHDGELLLEEITENSVRELAGMAPFGAGNPEPSFVAAGITPRQVRKVGGSHLKFIACQGGFSFPAIAFGMADRIHEFSGEMDILFSPVFNHWRGTRSIQLRVRDLRQSPAAERLISPASAPALPC